MSRMHTVIHADRDRDDDHSGTTQQDVQRATLESDRPTTPRTQPRPRSHSQLSQNGSSGISLSHAHTFGSPPSLGARCTVSPSHVTGHRQAPGECSQSRFVCSQSSVTLTGIPRARDCRVPYPRQGACQRERAIQGVVDP